MSETSIHPVTDFPIEIADSALRDLRQRLVHARLPEPLPLDGWGTGIPVATLRDLVSRRAEHD